MRFLVSFLLAFIVATVTSEKARYDNYRLYRLTPKSTEQVQALRELQQLNQYDFWNVARINKSVNVLVPPHKRPQFNDFLKDARVSSQIQVENLQTLIDEEDRRLSARSTKAVDWTDYHTLQEVYDWLDELAANHPNVETVVGGTTYEGRDIKGIEINNGDNLPGVVIESGIHAREWITVGASSWIINEILKENADPIWRQFNYVYFPSVNPDGYVYTWEKDRLWRKTRKPYKWTVLTCYGADPNRNWGSHWEEGGSSDNPCTETYAGPTAFSEPETETLADYFRSVSKSRNNQIYVAYHSYSQLLMFPWGYTQQHIPEYDTYLRIAKAAVEDLKAVHGTVFDYGDIYSTIYQTSGTSTEWYYDELKPTLSYTYEMRDTGRYGFELPPDQIIPTGEEHLASLKRILQEYQNLKA